MKIVFGHRHPGSGDEPPIYWFSLWLRRLLWPVSAVLSAYVAYDVGSDLPVPIWQTVLGSIVFGGAALVSAVCTYESWAFGDD